MKQHATKKTRDTSTALSRGSPEQSLAKSPQRTANDQQQLLVALAPRIGVGLGLAFMAAVVASLPCLLLPIGLVVLARLGSGYVSSGAYGSARWATRRELSDSAMLSETGMIVGRAMPQVPPFWPCFFRLFTAPVDDSREVSRLFWLALFGRYDYRTPLIRDWRGVHGCTVASPGSGKNVGVVYPMLLSYLGSAVVCDPKSENYKVTAKARYKHFQQRIIRLDPMELCGPKGASFNPLATLDIRSPMIVDLCRALAEAMVVTTGHEHDPHWNDSSKDLISGTILFVVVYAKTPEDRTLQAVADIIGDPESFAGMIALMQDATGDLAKTHGHLKVYRYLQQFGNRMSAWKDRELASVISTTNRHLAWLQSELIEKHLSRSDFDPRDLLRRDTTVYLILPPKYMASLSRLMRLWLTSIYNTITECGAQEDRKVLLLLDEIGNIGPLPCLLNALTMGRGYGVRVWLILQSIAQLKTLFPKEGEYQAADASIDVKQFFGIRDYQTAELVSNLCGTSTVAVTSYQNNSSNTTNGTFRDAILNDRPVTTSRTSGESTTVSETGRKLMMPDEVMRMPEWAMVVFTKGMPAISATLPYYYEAPEFAHLLADTRSAPAK
jgi:type IV secretion system protein VirD4